MDCAGMTFLQVMQNLQSKAHENVTIMFKQLSHDELFGIKRAQEAAKAEIAMQFQAGAPPLRTNGSPMRTSTLEKAQAGDMLTQLIAKADTGPAPPPPAMIGGGSTNGPPANGGGKGGKGGGEGGGGGGEEPTSWW
jgi:hypothetical protein